MSLKLAKHTNAEMVATANYLYECQFEILPDSAIAIWDPEKVVGI
jgi:hypothetical protein